jgi:hypothetical protein
MVCTLASVQASYAALDVIDAQHSMMIGALHVTSAQKMRSTRAPEHNRGVTGNSGPITTAVCSTHKSMQRRATRGRKQ